MAKVSKGIIKEYLTKSLSELQAERQRLQNLLRREFEEILKGSGSLKGYQNNRKLSINISFSNNLAQYDELMKIIGAKEAHDRIWHDDCCFVDRTTQTSTTEQEVEEDPADNTAEEE